MNKEAFRQGFLEGLAEKGYTPSELEDGIEKMSGVPLWPLLGGGAGVVLLLGLSGARFAARAGGRGAAAIVEPSTEDITAARREEILKKYKTLTLEAKQRALEQANTTSSTAW